MRESTTALNWIVVLLLGFVPFAGCGGSTQARVRVVKEDVQFVDGDTIRYEGTTVRLMGFDTPEGPSPAYEGDQGEPAKRASLELRRLVDSAEVVELQYYPEKDRYGRRLAHLYVDGTTVAIPMIKAGLAYETVTRFGEQGFAEEAKAIKDAARRAPEPDFENPRDWRARHRK